MDVMRQAEILSLLKARTESKSMQNENTKLRIVRLLEPALCMSCRFATIANVDMVEGASRRMLHCKRMDCDNWQTEDAAETPRSINEMNE